jgi:hypothetical protein
MTRIVILRSRSGFRLAARTPRERLKLKVLADDPEFNNCIIAFLKYSVKKIKPLRGTIKSASQTSICSLKECTFEVNAP